ncbi:MAG: hypothetical protein IJU54_03175 [Alphaproteobacteria bacterium]|nr:hypothetical protein [Alphaproteobacteria bacterium]
MLLTVAILFGNLQVVNSAEKFNNNNKSVNSAKDDVIIGTSNNANSNEIDNILKDHNTSLDDICKEIVSGSNKFQINQDDAIYKNIADNNKNNCSELFNFHHNFTVAKLNYMYSEIDINNEIAKSKILDLISLLSYINNAITGGKVTSANDIYNYQDLMNEAFKELKKHLINNHDRTIVSKIMNNCLNCCYIAEEYIKKN